MNQQQQARQILQTTPCHLNAGALSPDGEKAVAAIILAAQKRLKEQS
jgi:hypothetical protein